MMNYSLPEIAMCGHCYVEAAPCPTKSLKNAEGFTPVVLAGMRRDGGAGGVRYNPVGDINS